MPRIIRRMPLKASLEWVSKLVSICGARGVSCSRGSGELIGRLLSAIAVAAALALLWLIAAYAIVFGVLAILFGFRVRSLGRHLAVPV